MTRTMKSLSYDTVEHSDFWLVFFRFFYWRCIDAFILKVPIIIIWILFEEFKYFWHVFYLWIYFILLTIGNLIIYKHIFWVSMLLSWKRKGIFQKYPGRDPCNRMICLFWAFSLQRVVFFYVIKSKIIASCLYLISFQP